ncbi:glycosyltransferase involved in cell wall bisynthesis [Streptomyces sp. TLI_235]|nr:glycosyltransferase [Streptomyces sp. TLI_235]PBC77198.1 glycosyltransferase involved in cell wall bisynthesis [Streptomyces sp. TLI_235]
MKVLHVVTGLAAGGAERQLHLLLRHLPDRHHCEVAVLTNPGTVAEALRADGFAVHELDMRGNRDLAVLPRLTRLIRTRRYHAVHTHLYRAGLYGRLAARLAGVRTVLATEHSLHPGVIEGRPAGRGVRALYLAAERLGRTTVAVSGQVADTLRDWGVPEHRVHLLPNGIDAAGYAVPAARRTAVRAELGLPAGAFTVGAVGRLVPGKRFAVLVEALAALAARPGGPETRMLLVGEGPERAALAAHAARAGVTAVFTGERDDVPELLAAMDVLAAPSTEETFGLTVLEGLAAGLPVLRTACPALDALGPDAAPGARRLPSTAEAYTEALDALRTAPPRRLPPPPAVHHYDIARIAAELADLYDRLGPARTAAPRPAALWA